MRVAKTIANPLQYDVGQEGNVSGQSSEIPRSSKPLAMVLRSSSKLPSHGPAPISYGLKSSSFTDLSAAALIMRCTSTSSEVATYDSSVVTL